MITLSTPLLLDRSMMVLRAGMSDSQPSRPNRFSDDHFLWRNSSNLRDVQSPLLFFFVFFLHGKLPRRVEERYRPRGPDHSAQQGPLLLGAELHDARRLELLPDPLALLHVVDEHELHANVLTVGGLKEKGKKRDNP